MSGLYKPTYRDKKTGQTKKCICWWAWWTDPTTKKKIRRNTECRDKTAAQARLTYFMTRAERQRAGITSPYEDSLSLPLTQHLDEWERHLRAKGSRDTARYQHYVTMLVGRARLVLVELLKYKRITDMRASEVGEVIGGFRHDAPPTGGRKRRQQLSPRTLNCYIRSTKQFSRWLQLDRRHNEHALAPLTMFNAKVDQRHARRSLDEQEVWWLLETTRNSATTFRDMTPQDRYVLYLLMLNSGLRTSETASLSPSSFHLDAGQPTIHLRAAFAKNGKTVDQPIPARLVPVLKLFLRDRDPHSLLWPSTWVERAIRMWRADLAAAREAWIADAMTPQEQERRAGSEFLVYRNSAGLFADVHSMRHTYGSLLLRAGVPVRVVQELMRHSTVTLTMDTYGHVGLFDLSAGVEALPRFEGAGSSPGTSRASGA